MDKSYKVMVLQSVIFIIVIIFLIFIFIEFRKIDKKGTECIQDPFIYGTNLMIEKDKTDYMFNVDHQGRTLTCSCSMIQGGVFSGLG